MHEPRPAPTPEIFRRQRLVHRVVITAILIAGCAAAAAAETPSGFELLGRGVNYGNMLEAPHEGEWGARFHDDYARLVKEAGFESVRVPIRWSSHAATTAPYAIDADFAARIKHVVDRNLAQGLKVVVNVHHYEELYADPEAERPRFLAVWEQIARQFADADQRVFFELLNEPHGKLSGELWNQLLADALKIIRPRHPDRWIVVGPDQWNAIHRLGQLKLPDGDRRLIVTAHYYLPIDFTHQGASWVRPTLRVGKTWEATAQEREAIRRHFSTLEQWGKEHDRPVYLGEFGAIDKADLDSRVRWTREIRTTCEDSGFAWAYWELAAGFGILDPNTNQWRPQLLQALIER